jgi:hypothetical protein
MATGPNVPKVVGTKEKESEKGDKGRDKESAAGSLTGSRLRQGSLGSTTYLSEVYTGIGSLVVPCARGEQKAITGDTIVTLTIEKDPPEDDVDIVFVIPKEGADAILGSQKDLTNADHDFIVSEKSARAALKNKKLGKTEENRETVTSPPALRQTSAASRSS